MSFRASAIMLSVTALLCGGLVWATTLSSDYSAATATSDNSLSCVDTKGPLDVDGSSSSLSANKTMLSAGSSSTRSFRVVKNPNGALLYSGSPGDYNQIYSDFTQISGELLGQIDSSTNWTSFLWLMENNDNHIAPKQSTRLEGGDLYLSGGQGKDCTNGLGSTRCFGGGLRLYGGAQGPHQSDGAGTGNNIAGPVIIDTPAPFDTSGTVDTLAGYPTAVYNCSSGTCYSDVSLGEKNANRVGVGRTDQSGTNAGTIIEGVQVQMTVAASGPLTIQQGTTSGNTHFGISSTGDIDFTGKTSGGGISFTPGSYGINMYGPMAMYTAPSGALLMNSNCNGNHDVCIYGNQEGLISGGSAKFDANTFSGAQTCYGTGCTTVTSSVFSGSSGLSFTWDGPTYWHGHDAGNSNYTVGASDDLVGFSSLGGGGKTVTLPSTSSANGRRLIVLDFNNAAATNNITVAAQSGETVNGAASAVVVTQNSGRSTCYAFDDGTHHRWNCGVNN